MSTLDCQVLYTVTKYPSCTGDKCTAFGIGPDVRSVIMVCAGYGVHGKLQIYRGNREDWACCGLPLRHPGEPALMVKPNL